MTWQHVPSLQTHSLLFIAGIDEMSTEVLEVYPRMRHERCGDAPQVMD